MTDFTPSDRVTQIRSSGGSKIVQQMTESTRAWNAGALRSLANGVTEYLWLCGSATDAATASRAKILSGRIIVIYQVLNHGLRFGSKSSSSDHHDYKYPKDQQSRIRKTTPKSKTMVTGTLR